MGAAQHFEQLPLPHEYITFTQFCKKKIKKNETQDRKKQPPYKEQIKNKQQKTSRFLCAETLFLALSLCNHYANEANLKFVAMWNSLRRPL